MPALHLRLRAYPVVLVDGTPVPLALKRAQALLALLSELTRKVARSQLGVLLWPDAASDVARTRLRRLVHQINLVLGFDAIVGDADGLWLAAPAWTSDVGQTRHAARRLLDAPVHVRTPEDLALLLLDDAHQMLDGFGFGADRFDDWLAERRAELHRLVVRALQRAGEQLVRSGQPVLAIEVGQRLVALDPLADAGHALLLHGHAHSGDLAALESAYLAFADLLRAELGVRPSPAYEALYLDLRRQATQPVPAQSLASRSTAVMAPPIRYADADDGAVAYLELGSGPETLVVLFGISHLELAWDHPTIRGMLLELSRHRRVVLLDRRGVGLSERLSPDLSTQAGAADIEAVRRAVGADQVWLFGIAAGGMIAIEYAAARRSAVAGLVLYAANARGAWASDYPWPPTAEELQAWAERLRTHWGESKGQADVAPTQAQDPAARDWWARVLRHAVSRNTLPTLVREFARMDVRHHLPQLQVPVLILQREGDRIVPPDTARYLAEHIPHARLCMLPGEDHHLWAGDVAPVVAGIERFLLTGG